MTTRDTRHTMDGYARQRLREGYTQKGGQNPQASQIQVRPPAPASLRPTSSPQPTSPRNTGSKSERS